MKGELLNGKHSFPKSLLPSEFVPILGAGTEAESRANRFNGGRKASRAFGNFTGLQRDNIPLEAGAAKEARI